MAASNTVIVGAGIIGCSTAYYLSQSPRTPAQNIHLVEASAELFQSASGLAGGFLAADWFAPSVAPLGALSFKLHRELAEQHGGREKWGYSNSTGTSLSQAAGNRNAVEGRGEDWLRDGNSRANAAQQTIEFKEKDGPAWLTRQESTSLEVISGNEDVAQVNPRRLCQWLLDQSLQRGVQLHQPAQPIAVSRDARDELAAVRVQKADGTETDIPCTRLVLTAGAWTPKVFSTLFPHAGMKIQISPLAGHSLLVKSPRWTKDMENGGCHAVFATDTLGFSPELFSRVGEELYIAGLNSTAIPLPNLATDVKCLPEAIETLKATAARFLGIPGGQDDLQVLRAGLCFRPVTASGRPLISRVPDQKLGGNLTTRPGGDGGVYIAAGHGPWGISQSLGTGQVLAEMVEGRPTSANVKALSLEF